VAVPRNEKNPMTSPQNTAKGLIVAGTHTSVGKSSIAMGLMRCFRNRGHAVRPFKVGPDYIDPGHHQAASGRPGYNLDSWMCSPDYIRRLFADVLDPGDLFVAEGVMGLYDGAHAVDETGTTAETARLLGIPVLLVIDGSCLARSAAALVQGFAGFDPRINVFGVIANRVNSPGHAAILQEAIEHYTDVRFLGYLPRKEELQVSHRHLGLHTSREQADGIYEQWAQHVEEHVDVAALLESLPTVQTDAVSPKPPAPQRWKQPADSRPFSVAVARDEALHFIYEDTLDLIRHYGGRIHFFSPLNDTALPEGVDWVYLPGGYPELHAPKLSGNTGLLQAIRDFGHAGGLIVGECGGLMLLGEALIDADGTAHPMAGLFRFTTSMTGKKLTIGYRHLVYHPPDKAEESVSLKGHEFHFSGFDGNFEAPVMDAYIKGKESGFRDGYRFKNTFALYSHIYWGSSLEWFEYILTCTRHRKAYQK